MGIFCHFLTQIPLKYLKIPLLELTNKPGTKKLSFGLCQTYQTYAPAQDQCVYPWLDRDLKTIIGKSNCIWTEGRNFYNRAWEGKNSLSRCLFLEKQIIYCEADGMRPYQPPSHVSRNKQYDARRKYNTLGWIEIKRPLLGSQIAFELSLGVSKIYKIARK